MLILCEFHVISPNSTHILVLFKRTLNPCNLLSHKKLIVEAVVCHTVYSFVLHTSLLVDVHYNESLVRFDLHSSLDILCSILLPSFATWCSLPGMVLNRCPHRHRCSLCTVFAISLPTPQGPNDRLKTEHALILSVYCP